MAMDFPLKPLGEFGFLIESFPYFNPLIEYGPGQF
jgi:hypothetical protein